MPRWGAFTYFFHILLDDGLAEALLRTGATGLSYRSVYAVMPDKRQVKLRWKQLCAERTLAPMSSSTSGFARNQPCEVCNRNGYFVTSEAPTRVVYRASDLRGADDVNQSWENQWFAISSPSQAERRSARTLAGWVSALRDTSRVSAQGDLTLSIARIPQEVPAREANLVALADPWMLMRPSCGSDMVS